MRGARLHWLLAGVAVALAGLVYVNALDNPFVYDDRRLVVENRSLRNPLDLYAVAVHEATRPVVNLSYAIDRMVWGPKPFGFHLTNVLLHMINVALLFDFTRRTTGRRLAACDRLQRGVVQGKRGQALVRGRVALVGDIVSRPCESVDRDDRGAQRCGNEPRCHREIFVMTDGHAVCGDSTDKATVAGRPPTA